jgi:DNA-binding MarR family transcriptional regulator
MTRCLGALTVRMAKQRVPMTTSRPPRDAAREILKIVPLVMRTVAAELRANGELPAPAHFGLLTILARHPRTLTELAMLQGVSLPTMSNSISRLVERGWVRRVFPARDRRVVIVEATALGKATVKRVGRAAEAHLAEKLSGLEAESVVRLHAGLAVLRRVFAEPAGRPKNGRGSTRRARTSR